MNTMRRAAFAVWVACLAPSAFAGVLVVDSAGASGAYLEIQAAVTAAAPGDLVLVRAGTYAAFVVAGKSLSIVADAAATVHVVGDCAIRGLPANSAVVCRGLAFGPPLVSPGTRLELTTNLGRIRVEDCSFAPNDAIAIVTQPKPTVLVDACTSVTFARCTSTGRASPDALDAACPALVVSDSTVRIESSTLIGGDGADSQMFSTSILPVATAGAEALRVAGGDLFLGGSILRGGQGGNGSGDMLVDPCDPPGQSGAGIVIAAPGGLVRSLACTIESGAPGLVHGFCEPLDPPKPIVVTAAPGTAQVVVLTGASNSAIADATVDELGTASLLVIGVPGEFVFALIGVGPDATFVPALSSVLYESATPLVVVALGAIPASGTLSLSVPLQLSVPALSAVSGHVQAATCSGSGECRLGSPTVVTILDSAL
ncbi:MAG: hypothetical protein JNL94_13380 [Planctomycetes bacterium]|nr:hypothetical protein [Planctomycetota bacterium]